MTRRELKQSIQRALYDRFGMAPILKEIAFTHVFESVEHAGRIEADFRVNGILYHFHDDPNSGPFIKGPFGGIE